MTVLRFDTKTLMQATEMAIRWVDRSTGDFSAFSMGKDCQIENADMCAQVIDELRSKGLIEPVGQKNNWFRKSDNECPVIKWEDAEVYEYPVILPLCLSERVVVSPGNVIVIAGEKNSGKSTFVYKTIHDNLTQHGGQHPVINLFDYECEDGEMKGRLMTMNPKIGAWAGLNPRRRFRNFHSVIDPNGFNVIDYLKLRSDDFTKVGDYLADIHEKLTTGIAIVCIQKKKGADYARGGELSTEECRLAVSLFSDGPCKWAKIIHAKFPRIYPHPEGMEVDYEVEFGRDITSLGEWGYVTKTEREKIIQDKVFEAKRNQRIAENSQRGFGVHEK